MLKANEIKLLWNIVCKTKTKIKKPTNQSPAVSNQLMSGWKEKKNMGRTYNRNVSRGIT